jgi:hypothetical protein
MRQHKDPKRDITKGGEKELNNQRIKLSKI